MRPIKAKVKNLKGKLVYVEVLQFLSHRDSVVAICQANNEFVLITPSELIVDTSSSVDETDLFKDSEFETITKGS